MKAQQKQQEEPEPEPDYFTDMTPSFQKAPLVSLKSSSFQVGANFSFENVVDCEKVSTNIES